MVSLERLSSSANRGTFYFLGRRNFIQFAELCVGSYPSPLEDSAPWPAKLSLLAIAGLFEFMAIHFLADVLDILWRLVPWVASLLRQGWDARRDQIGDPDGNKVYNSLVYLLLSASFIIRAQSYFRRHPLKTRHDGLASAFVWLNPSLFWHLLLTVLPGMLGAGSARMRLLPLFWRVMSPGMGRFPTTWSSIPFWPGVVEKETERWKSMSYWDLANSGLRITVMETLVSVTPRVLIRATLWIQSRLALMAGKGSKPRLGGVPGTTADRRYHSILLFLERCHRRLDSVVSALLGYLLSVVAVITNIARVIVSIQVSRNSRNSSTLYDVRDASTTAAQRIRLLCILPAESNSDPIQCTMEWHDLSSLPSYKAISYTWGSQTRTHAILVNNSRAEVTQTAHDVLVRARSSWRRQTVWIDAICIDQSSSADKLTQLPLMPLIYERATKVIVWLGPCNPNTAALAVRLVDRLFVINRLEASWGRRVPYEISPAAASALRRMLTRPWFSRAWVVQEVVRAGSETVVWIWYGEESLNWERLSWFTQVAQEDSALLKMLADRSGDSSFASLLAFQNTSIMRRFSRLRSDERPLSLLFYLVQMFRADGVRFDATEDRDRVYALLGLSGSANRDIKPDYDRDLRRCYVDSAWHFIQAGPKERALDFLVHAGTGYGPQIAGLPSWVPDWTVKPRCNPLLGTEGAAELLRSATVEELIKDAVQLAIIGDALIGKGYDSPEERALASIQVVRERMLSVLPDATKGTTPSIRLLPDSTTISVRGRRFDRIRAVGDAAPGPIQYWKDRLQVTVGWARLAAETERSGPQPYGPGGIPVAFVRTLFTDVWPPRFDFTFASSPEKGIPGEAVQGAPILFMGFLGGLHLLDIPGLSTEPLKEMVDHAGFVWEGRVFGVTEGGYFGLFLDGTKEGDLVCLFGGLAMPVCLRRAEAGLEETFELVGPAYVQGIMDGTAMSLGLKEEAFKLI